MFIKSFTNGNFGIVRYEFTENELEKLYDEIGLKFSLEGKVTVEGEGYITQIPGTVHHYTRDELRKLRNEINIKLGHSTLFGPDGEEKIYLKKLDSGDFGIGQYCFTKSRLRRLKSQIDEVLLPTYINWEEAKELALEGKFVKSWNGSIITSNKCNECRGGLQGRKLIHVNSGEIFASNEKSYNSNTWFRCNEAGDPI